ncbi:integrin alpha-PS3-like isoform X1 [Scylla paramamosain]|uniref:integrin alpha-PS3-like isoform X1 n=1 Tax=Scylla paramamosain TaxID=85552 RepID=UPI003082B8CA
MALVGRELAVLAGLLWAASLTVCFNLEPRTRLTYSYPYAATQGREPYFGFAVALQINQVNDTNWLMVGAPRANSSIYKNHQQITEPGALFKCNLNGQKCDEFIVDDSGNTETPNQLHEFSYHDMKNFGWLGGSLDSQPNFREDRQVTGVCAPRWKNQIYRYQRYMNGACYWIDNSKPNAKFNKKLPLVNHEKQTTTINDKTFYFYGHGQAGMSIHFPDDQTKFIVGAPGVFNWHGTVILYQDSNWNNPEGIARRRRQAWWITKRDFQHDTVPNPSYFTRIRDCDLFGYAVTSGRFLSERQILYAGGAPRGAESYGKVLVFDFSRFDNNDLKVMMEMKGEQLGEYFGSALTAADINGDGLSDLVVGSPMYSLPNIADVGTFRTYLSNNGRGLRIQSTPYYGNKVYLARFGTSLVSPGDLNMDGYEDIIAGAPWEGNGAVYVFLGSATGLKQQYSQRLAPEDFNPVLRGFGVSLSRGNDIDKNGYPDLAIGSFLSGHVVVMKTRPVVMLSGHLTSSPANVAWEGITTLNLTTCLRYSGHRIPSSSSIQVTLTLDHDSPAPRAVFNTKKYILTFNLTLAANSAQPTCRSEQVTVKEDKIDPDQPIVMKMDYDLVKNPRLELIKQPVTNPGEIHSNITRVGILKGCVEEVCRVDLTFDADLDLEQGNKLVVGQRTKPVLRVQVFSSGEPAYLPTMVVKVDLPLTLLLPTSHDCKFFDDDLRTSLECQLSNPLKKGGSDTVEVSVDASQLTDRSTSPGIQVNVAGEGHELKPEDNQLFINLQLVAQADMVLHGDSKEEQVFYTHVDKNHINATINPRFTHSYVVFKRGPTPIGEVDLNIDIPVNTSDGHKLVKLYPPKTTFKEQPFQCKLSSGSFDIDISDNGNVDDGIIGDDGEMGGSSNAEPHIKELTVNVENEGDETQYFNCSSSLVRCARLSCRIYNWPQGTNSAKISFNMEVDLQVMARYINMKGGAIFASKASANIQSLNSLLGFVGEKVAQDTVVTYIQPDTLRAKGIPWWVILLAVLGGLLLLGLLAYGMYKSGFFKREKMEEMKAQQANVVPSNSYGTSNPGYQ